MSMLFNLRRISNKQADALVQDSSDIFFFLHGDEPYEPPKGFFQKLFRSKEQKIERVWEQPKEDSVLELDNNWHLLHYLLAGVPWEGAMPQASLMGGIELGKIDVGYGPARLLRLNEVEAFLTYLNSLDKNEFGKNITGEDLEEQDIYGGNAEWRSEFALDLWEYVEDLKTFLAKVKQDGQSVILYLY